ncbi:hypothetical protein FRB90_007561 [Tulasnella sp. 427]|nr:hypothetical protein FRB90_007561 [Tulasnella sp. 427]
MQKDVGIPAHSTFLSLAQIHRVLRPLRTKVLALSKSITAASTKSRARQTLVSSFQERNPLAVVPHPSRFQFSTRSSSVLSEWDPASHELDSGLPIIDFARKAHAISDAFRNVVTRAYADELSHRIDTIPPLMQIATSIIGDDIEASVMELLRANKPLNSDDSTFEVDEDDEEDETYIIDGCYEQIPDHLRRWALVPHAVKMILIRAPNSPTILETCLDIALEHGSTRDALSLLRRLLSIAFTRRPSDDIPIKSSQHRNYLVHLLRKPNNPSKPINSAWSDIELTEEVISALSRADLEDQEELWSAVAVRELFAAVSEEARLCLATAFSAFCADCGRQRSRTQLRTWVEQILCTRLAQGFNDGTYLEEVDIGVYLRDICTSMATLVDQSPRSSVAEFFRDVFICLAVRALSVSHPVDTENAKSRENIVHLLFPFNPTTSPASFNSLITAISDSFPPELRVTCAVELIANHAQTLEEGGLHRMEGALLAAGVNALENDVDPTKYQDEADVCALRRLRARLVEAEARCVGGGHDGSETRWRYDEDHGWVTATPAVVAKVSGRGSLNSFASSIKRKRPLRIEDDEEDEDEDTSQGPAKRLQLQSTPYLERLDHNWGSSPDPMHLKTPGPRTALRRGIAARPRSSLRRLSSLSCHLANASQGADEDDESAEGDEDAMSGIEEAGEVVSLHSSSPARAIFKETVPEISIDSSSPGPVSPSREPETAGDHLADNNPDGDSDSTPNHQTSTVERRDNIPLLDLPTSRRLLNLPAVPRAAGRGAAMSGKGSLPPRLAQALRRMSGSGSLGIPRGREV